MPLEYTLTLKGARMLKKCSRAELQSERFMLPLTGGDQTADKEPPLMIFASRSNLEMLHQSEFWVADGTFEKCPKPYAQLYTIHGFVKGEGTS